MKHINYFGLLVCVAAAVFAACQQNISAVIAWFNSIVLWLIVMLKEDGK